MLPRDLKPEHFRSYEPEASKLAIQYIGTLQRLPLSFVPSVLREIAEYDFKFPAERDSLEKELQTLHTLSHEQLNDWFYPFTQIKLSSQLEHSDWVSTPAQFVEQLSTELWTTHQLDAFRTAATAYANHLQSAVPPAKPLLPRLGISIIGKGVTSYDGSLFRKLRPHGASFSNIKPENGLMVLLDRVAERAKAHPAPFGHWYIDGSQAAEHDATVTCVAYDSLEPARTALLKKIRAETARPGMGPEALRTVLSQLRPADVILGKTNNAVLARFQLKLLTEGSGTQIFSTTFTQWAAREVLRRAQPLTLLVRFAPRQRQKPMNELLSPSSTRAEIDSVGSLIDGDMGAYYNWINQQRLPGADQSSFVVWFEDHNQAVAIGPSVPRGTESSSPTSIKELLSWVV